MSTFFDLPVESNRPWGKFVQFTQDELSTVKILTIKAGEAFSLQHHKNREEFWVVLSGSGLIEIGDKSFEAKVGDRFIVPKEANHRITGGEEDLIVLEIATGHFDEEDIVRLEDRYGRVTNE